jgi:hypothetical protein
VQGVSTRKVKAITEELCGHSFSASSISAMNQRLDDGLARPRSFGDQHTNLSSEIAEQDVAEMVERGKGANERFRVGGVLELAKPIVLRAIDLGRIDWAA